MPERDEYNDEESSGVERSKKDEDLASMERQEGKA